jgi:hypothetical protein
MTDDNLIKRLRNPAHYHTTTGDDNEAMSLAADEIERLRADVTHWREARRIALEAGDWLKERAERAEAERDALRTALQLLHDNTADYVRINNLGDPYQNADMRMAKAALAKGEGK